MLKIVLSRLKPQTEMTIAEEQAGFRAGCSTTDQIFNLRILGERYLKHQQNLYPVFVDFKKAFERVWHTALRKNLRAYNINAQLINVKQHQYDRASSAVYPNGRIGNYFRTTSF